MSKKPSTEDLAPPLSDEQIAELATLVGQRQAEVEAALVTVTDDARPVSLDEPIGRLSRMDAMQQQQMASARRNRLEGQRLQITAALARLRQDEYGECVRCHEPIGYERLKASPETPMCVQCQQKFVRR